MHKVNMKPPDGGEPVEVEARPDIIVPLLVAGWSQCPQQKDKEGTEDAIDG
ncbi:MAG: hypothetical protein IT165_06160 [Bryobacterales bacterium]|nr:hypothetical protein [Bryobacterales bacterium]